MPSVTECRAAILGRLQTQDGWMGAWRLHAWARVRLGNTKRQTDGDLRTLVVAGHVQHQLVNGRAFYRAVA